MNKHKFKVIDNRNDETPKLNVTKQDIEDGIIPFELKQSEYTELAIAYQIARALYKEKPFVYARIKNKIIKEAKGEVSDE